MKRIFIIGAGRSSTTLIHYLQQNAQTNNWTIVVGDKDIKTAQDRIGTSVLLTPFDVNDATALDRQVQQADLVISMLPARFHLRVAPVCLRHGKNLLTPSYEAPELQPFKNEIKEKGLLFLNEMGLDPGIDHMSAMKEIDTIKEEGHELLSFESFTGGLIAPESDDNPWHYKLTWNPLRVVLAGNEGPAKFIQEGKYKYIPYNRLFRRTELIEIENYGWFEGYANRDSLKYIDLYQLQGVPTVYRGTLRRPGFCRAWNIFVQLGMTDNSYLMEGLEKMARRDFVNSFLYYHPSDSVEVKLYHDQHIDQDSDIIVKLKWLGIFDDTPIGLKKGTPANVLEHILNEKWQLAPDDKDMTVIWHKFIYKDRSSGKSVKKYASLVVTGENQLHTAMSKTVGLPIGIAAKLILTGKLRLKGLFIPTKREIYFPILQELQKHGIQFKTTTLPE